MNKNNTSLKRQYFKFIVPSIASMWFFSIYTMVDGAFVGRGVGPEALAGVNLSMPYTSLVFCLSILLSVGSSNLITYHLGRGDKELSDQYFSQSLVLVLAVGTLIALLALSNLSRILDLLKVPPSLYSYAQEYLEIILIFSPFFMLSYCMEVLVKADGHPNLAPIFVSLSAFTNIFLDYLLVIRFPYGVRGAALATGISQAVAVIGYSLHFFSKRSSLNFVWPRISLCRIWEVARLGLPEAMTELSIGFFSFVFNFSILRLMGSPEVAAFSIIMYLSNLVLNTMIAINQGGQPLVSYNYGRGRLSQLRDLSRLMLATSITMGFFFFLISNLFSHQIVSLFLSSNNQDLIDFSRRVLGIFSSSFPLVGINIILSGFLTATQNPRLGFFLSTLRGYLSISLSLFIITQLFGPEGIWIASLISELATLSISLILFQKNAKNLKKDIQAL